MAVIHDVQPVKPVCAVTFAPKINYDDVVQRLIPLLGAVDDQSSVFAFDFTDYYLREMGAGLSKVFVGFNPLVRPIQLSAFKRATQILERQWMTAGCRKVNLDPAYIGLSKLVVASVKDHAHRLYIGEGVYADLQLQYRQGCFHPLPWTFADYQTPLALTFFKDNRDQLAYRLRHEIDQL